MKETHNSLKNREPATVNGKEHGFRGAMAKPYQNADFESVLEKVLG